MDIPVHLEALVKTDEGFHTGCLYCVQNKRPLCQTSGSCGYILYRDIFLPHGTHLFCSTTSSLNKTGPQYPVPRCTT